MALNRGELREECYFQLARILKTTEKRKEFIDEIVADLQRDYPDIWINKLLNEGQRFVVRYSECLRFRATFPSVADASWYRLWGNCLQLKSVYYNNKKLNPITQDEVDNWFDGVRDENWRTADAGTPIMYFQESGSSAVGAGHSVQLIPEPDTSDVTILIRGTRAPDNMDADGNTCAFEDDSWARLVVRYVIYTLTDNRNSLAMLQAELLKIKIEQQTSKEEMIRGAQDVDYNTHWAR